MRQAHTTFEVRTPGRGLVEITPQVARWLAGTGITRHLDALAAAGFVQKMKVGRSNHYINVVLNQILTRSAGAAASP